MIGFDVQDLTTQLRTLKESQQTNRNVTPGRPTSSPQVKVVTDSVCLPQLTR